MRFCNDDCIGCTVKHVDSSLVNTRLVAQYFRTLILTPKPGGNLSFRTDLTVLKVYIFSKLIRFQAGPYYHDKQVSMACQTASKERSIIVTLYCLWLPVWLSNIFQLHASTWRETLQKSSPFRTWYLYGRVKSINGQQLINGLKHGLKQWHGVSLNMIISCRESLFMLSRYGHFHFQ